MHARAHSIALPQRPIYNLFNAGSPPHPLPWNLRPSLQLWVMAVATPVSVFQGGAKSLRDPPFPLLSFEPLPGV